MPLSKLIVVVGITDLQGDSVAQSFLQFPGWNVRGISRNIYSDTSLQWTSIGVEMVTASLSNTDNLCIAFADADAIFGGTEFWGQMKNLIARIFPAMSGNPLTEAYNTIERRYGNNLADAATSVAGLERFLLSTLSGSTFRSQGGVMGAYGFGAKWLSVQHLRSNFLALSSVTSLVQAASFIKNYRTLIQSRGDGIFIFGTMRPPEVNSPWIHPPIDIGTFIKAFALAPPRQNLAGGAENLNWNQICGIFTKFFSIPIEYKQYLVARLDVITPRRALTLANIFSYFEYHECYVDDSTIMYPSDLEHQLGIPDPTTRFETFPRNNFPSFLEKAACKIASQVSAPPSFLSSGILESQVKSEPATVQSRPRRRNQPPPLTIYEDPSIPVQGPSPLALFQNWGDDKENRPP
ncbi:NAD(P)-binding protein [Lindgomyces ingoldianus]|uniref:NAD(P)-binding protein n=1 Tax=Lindgomyces ingoldianus TaxID=673940 RepID=A0ACB6QEH0_9PLEO|nr:NAD(P)-binding protein [Lindgomyces ingoldianus]KAF2465316.1 NAD(P)-binding protein [Lindgomyces ingoldianus]